MKQRTFAMIKPHAVASGNIGAIITALEQADFMMVALQKIHLTKEKADELYAIHRTKPFFNEMIKSITAGPVVLAVLEKQNAIQSWRTLMGATDPADAAPGTLRKRFGQNIGNNAVHGSDSEENAAIEISIFFPELSSKKS